MLLIFHTCLFGNISSKHSVFPLFLVSSLDLKRTLPLTPCHSPLWYISAGTSGFLQCLLCFSCTQHQLSCLPHNSGVPPVKVTVSRDTDQAQQSWHSIQVFRVRTSESYSFCKSNADSLICAGSQRPDYVALTQRVDPTGNVTAYSKTRERIKQAALLRICQILLVPASLPRTSRHLSLGEQTLQISHRNVS